MILSIRKTLPMNKYIKLAYRIFNYATVYGTISHPYHFCESLN